MGYIEWKKFGLGGEHQQEASWHASCSAEGGIWKTRLAATLALGLEFRGICGNPAINEFCGSCGVVFEVRRSHTYGLPAVKRFLDSAVAERARKSSNLAPQISCSVLSSFTDFHANKFTETRALYTQGPLTASRSARSTRTAARCASTPTVHHSVFWKCIRTRPAFEWLTLCLLRVRIARRRVRDRCGNTAHVMSSKMSRRC
jgi:hypothetical protein